MERTLLLIKPNVVRKNKIGAVIDNLESQGFVVRNIRMERLTHERAESFYEVHRGKPFYNKLVEFMASGPIVALVLERPDAVNFLRGFIGATDPAEALPGTIRRLYGDTVRENAVHASDSLENAAKEIAFLLGTKAVV